MDNKTEFNWPLYKYTDLKGVKEIIKNSTVRFSSPNIFNDPFELQLYDDIIFDDEFLEDLCTNFADHLIKCDTKFLSEEMKSLRDVIINLSEHKLGILRQENRAKIVNFDKAKRVKRESLTELQKSLNDFGILCFSETNDSLLMWAHYAEKHKGAVLGFRPNMELDSCFKLFKAVNYSQQRPVFLKNPSEFFDLKKNFKDRFEEVIFTKSKEWEYEKECRLFIPDIIKDGIDFYDLRFHSDELVSIHLGCKMKDDDKREIIDGAKILNGGVKIFEAELDVKSYKINFFAVS